MHAPRRCHHNRDAVRLALRHLARSAAYPKRKLYVDEIRKDEYSAEDRREKQGVVGLFSRAFREIAPSLSVRFMESIAGRSPRASSHSIARHY
jgi:hypothetical protein